MKKITIFLIFVVLTATSYSQCLSKVSVGGYHNIGLKPDGTIWSFGSGSSGYGVLGLGNDNDALTPTQVGSASNWTSISTGSYNTFALKSDGMLWGTGRNIHGELGNGSFGNNPHSLVQIGTATNWKTTAGNNDHTVGLKTNGTLWGWGFNNNGQVGDGTTIERYTPVQIGTDTNWKAVTSAIGGFNIALKTNGTLWVWGFNTSGSGTGVIDPSIVYFSSPYQIGIATDWSSMDSGFQHTLALKTNGTLYVFGGGVNGSCGHGLTDAPFISPTQIGTDSNWAQVSAGFNTSYGIKTDGTLWAWGQNDYGQLGDGTTEKKGFPTQIGTGTNWASVQAGEQHCVALKTDGSLWTWGDNTYGQLSTGGYTSSSVPVQVAVSGCALGNEEFKQTRANLYPNPTNDKVSIDNSTADYQSVAVYNYLGQEMIQQKLTFSNNQTIDLSGFSKGVYLFKLQSDNSTETIKVIKK